MSLICLRGVRVQHFPRGIFLSVRHCAPLVFLERIGVSGWHGQVSTSPGPRVGMASAVTLRVNRQVPICPGATVQDLFCCITTIKNLQEPSPREYQLRASSSAAGASSTPVPSWISGIWPVKGLALTLSLTCMLLIFTSPAVGFKLGAFGAKTVPFIFNLWHCVNVNSG